MSNQQKEGLIVMTPVVKKAATRKIQLPGISTLQSKLFMSVGLLLFVASMFIMGRQPDPAVDPGAMVPQTASFVVDTVYIEVEVPAKKNRVARKELQRKIITVPQSAKIAVWDLKPEQIKSPWDKLRYQIWLAALRIKANNPGLAATKEQIYVWSCKLISHESSYDINAHNRIDAQGLFQAIPKTRKWLGSGKLKGKSPEYQLNYYVKYINGCLASVDKTKINDFGDWYYLGLYPEHADKPDWTVFGKKGTANYRCNKGLDANKDGVITKGEVFALVNKRTH